MEMTSDLQEEPAEVRRESWLQFGEGENSVTTLSASSLQLVPYVGEDLVSVRVEPCSPAVSQERQEVLEVGGVAAPSFIDTSKTDLKSNFHN